MWENLKTAKKDEEREREKRKRVLKLEFKFTSHKKHFYLFYSLENFRLQFLFSHRL